MQFSTPTKAQIVHGLERVVAVFVVAAIGYIRLVGGAVSPNVIHAAFLAGVTAVYQLVISTLTTQ